MANKTLTTQILLRNDTLANWQASARVLGKGEPAIVFDPNTETEGYSVRVKYGDGVHTFSELPYSGVDLSDIPLASTTANGLLSKGDFDKIAKLAAVAYKDKIEEADLTNELREKVNAASEGNHAHLNKDALDKITTEKMSAWDAAQANVIESIKVNGTVVEVADKSVDIAVPTGALSTKDKVAETDLDEALAAKVNSPYDDTAIKADITANTDAITKLNGTGEGSVKKMIDDGINDFATKVSDDNVVNTFKELIDYCATHGTEAAELAGDIAANTSAIEALETLVGDKAVATQITEAIAAALKVDGVDKYALAADLADAVSTTTANETAIAAIKTKLDTIAEGATKVEASETNGNVKINGAEVTVFTMPEEAILSTDTLIIDGGNA